MANEVTVTCSLSFLKGNMDAVSKSEAAATFNVSGSKYVSAIQNIPTSEEAINMGEITDPGWAFFRNLDATNYVEIRPNTGVADCIRLNAGEFWCGRLAADAVPYAIANSSAVNLEYLIVQT